MEHEQIIRKALCSSTTPEAAERAIVVGLADVEIRGLKVGMTPEIRYATVIGRRLTNGLAFRATTNVPPFAWTAR